MSDLDNTKYEGNYKDAITGIIRRLDALERRGVNVNSLDEFTDDIGDQRAGRFLAMLSGTEPTDPDASGCFMSAGGEEFGGELYNIGGVENGALQFGMRNSDGAGVFAGGDAVIGSEGINIDQMGYLIQHTATDGTTERTGALGMWATPGSTEPCYGIAYNAPADETDILDGTNAGFETGDFTGWTKTTETVGSWEVYSKPVSEWNIFEGSYMAFFLRTTTTSSEINGVLTKARDEVTAGTKYKIIFGLAFSGWPTGYAKAEIKWYDHASAGTLIQTDLLAYQNTDTFPNLSSKSVLITAPAGALSCEIVVTGRSPARTSNALAISADGFTMNAVSISAQLYFDSTGALNLTGLPVFADSYAGFWTQFRGYLANGTEVAAITDTLASTDTRSGVYKLWNNTSFPTSGTYIECQVPLAQGTYTMELCRVKGTSFGKVDLYIDGVKQTATPIDFYGSTAYTIDTTITDVVVSGDGVHTVRFQMDSKNASSSGYGIGGSLFSFCKTS